MHERTIAASPSEVWKRLSDFARIGEWAGAVDHSSPLTAQAEGVGASRRVQSGSTVLVENVIEWHPDSTLAYQLVGLPAVVDRVVNRWTLEPVGDATRVTLTAEVTPGPRPPMRLAAPAVARRLGAVNRTLIDDLATAVERSEP